MKPPESTPRTRKRAAKIFRLAADLLARKRCDGGCWAIKTASFAQGLSLDDHEFISRYFAFLYAPRDLRRDNFWWRNPRYAQFDRSMDDREARILALLLAAESLKP